MPRETLFEEMKRYVRFDAEDARVLRAFGQLVAPEFPRISMEFYERIREHEEAHAVFIDEAQIDRLRKTLVRWMATLCAGPHDEAYFEERAKIGRVHVRIGLPQRYMFTAMGLIHAELAKLTERLPPDEARATRSALARLLDLELAIMLETYRDDSAARLQRIERLERERIARALARSEHRYANAVELARVVVIGLDRAGSVALFNREAERVTGYARDEAAGQPFAMLLPDDVRESEGERIRRVAAGSEATPEESFDLELRTRAGRRRTVQWRMAYAPLTTDEEVVLFAIGQDVTDERALLERTLRSEKLAAVGTLAAGLAHEIRNPLNGALLHVTYLERALKKMAANEDAMGAVQFVSDEIKRLSMLVKDFLVFARPSAPKLEPTSLRAVCERAAALVTDDARAQKVAFANEPAAHDVVLQADREKLQQVLLNLLRNAIDAAGQGAGSRVTLRSRRIPRGAVIEVEDDGPGLSSPDAPIFDAFYSTKPSGTGLGLAIVHRAVSDHGGTVEVESRPGRTVFRVVLPLGIDTTQAPEN